MKQTLAAGSLVLVLGLSQAAVSRPMQTLATPASETTTLYRMQKGDTLSGLAARYMSGAQDAVIVARLSGMANPNRAPVGTVLTIPTRLLKSTSITLTAVAVTGPVVRATAAGVVGPLAKGDAVLEGDRISTGANAFATLVKSDGTKVTLPSHVTLRVAVLRRLVIDNGARGDLVIESGRGQMAVTPLQGADRFEIRTPGSVAAVRGTEFRVAYDADKTVSTLEVLHGRVGESVSEATPAVDIVTGQAAQRPLGGERKITPLPPAPALAPPDAAATFPQVTLRIANAHPGWSYHFLLAHDADFTDIFSETIAPDGVARFDTLPLAPVSARITAIDENGVEGFAKTYLVKRAAPSQSTSGG